MATKSTIKLTDKQREALEQELAGRIPQIRSRRAWLTESWIRNHSAWRGTHTRSFFHSDIFSHFIPAARRAVERFVIRGAQMLIPSSQFFEVFPADELNDDAGKQAESVLAFLLYLLRKRIKSYTLVKKLLRCFTLYGRCIVKPGVKLEQIGRTKNVWPTVRVVDPFIWFMWPETADDIENATILFEDNLMPWESFKDAMDRGVVDKINRRDLTDPVWPHTITDRLSKSGISTPGSAGNELTAEEQKTDKGGKTVQGDKLKSKVPQQFVFVSEIWFRRGSRWWFVWLLWNVNDGPKIVRVSKTFFDRAPYRIAVAREIPGEFYTTSMMDDVEPLQVLANDQFNLTLEGQAMNFSPPVAIDANSVTRASSIVYRPRAKWFVKPEGIKFMETHDTTRGGYQGIQFTFGLIDQFSGSNSLAEGTPPRGLPRAGFAVSSLLNLSLADIKDAAITIEDMVLSPMLADLHRITVEMVPNSQIFKVPGTENFTPKRISPADLRGDFDFIWVGSLQSQDFQVRAQRLVSLLNILGNFAEPIARDLQLQGKKINWVGLLKRIWREGMGERGADSLIGDLTPQEQLGILTRQIADAQARAAGGPGGAPQQLLTAEELENEVLGEEIEEELEQ